MIYTELLIGLFLFLFGIYSSVVFNNPHFYTPFSIGSLLISLGLYRSFFKRAFFEGWNFRAYLVFWILLCLACLVVDRIGLILNYWHYPYYSGLFDEVIKITLEYAVPLTSFAVFVSLMSGVLNRIRLNIIISFLFSIVLVSSLILIFTEYINSFSDSWVVTIPLVVWFTVGAWLMALIPFIIYRLINLYLKFSSTSPTPQRFGSQIN